MPLTGAERIARYRAKRLSEGRQDTSQRNKGAFNREWKERERGQERPFVGCDGEGFGVDEQGRQNYVLFRIGGRELVASGKRLHTKELLEFICESPAHSILVGFAFGYDVTMILRDLPVAQQKRLFNPREFGQGHSPFVWYKDFDIDYLPKQYLRVRRVRIERQADGSEKRVGIQGSLRTIYETFGFFQKSFVKVLKEFGVGSEDQLKMIVRNKDKRGNFVGITQEVRDYCALECEFLAELMEKLRDYCDEAGIKPRTWNGAGKLASALHGKHNTIRSTTVNSLIPKEVHDLANMAYYGGRFEITRVGSIKEVVYEYDIRSAYPDAMRKLPCLVHGRWEKADASKLRSHNGLFVAGCSFKAARDTVQLGGFPIRSEKGHLYWPLQGSGIYWSPEVRAAQSLGFQVRFREGWVYLPDCSCHPFDWVEGLYDYRRSIGSSGVGYPIKLGINSLYGKLAQRKGNGAFNNMIWAGLITAFTRAKLNETIAERTQRIVMLATDAVYSLDPIEDLQLGERLGEWEHTILNSLFIVQPGLYWSPDLRKKKSRGLSGKFFEEAGRTESFESSWSYWVTQQRSKLDTPFPSVCVPVLNFIGLRLALSRNNPELAGTWLNDQREISFDYRNKRSVHTLGDGHIITGMKSGSPGLYSIPHRDFLAAGGHEPWEAARLMLEEQPDYVDLGIPFKD